MREQPHPAAEPLMETDPLSEAALLTTWSSHMAAALVAAGARDAVVSPGSRSTPFLLALQRHGGLRLHSVIDERAAAFMALGLARSTERPPILLCTSGTAPAHYAPAVIEASEAGLPLIVLSADRPTRLMGSGAPQTTQQLGLYSTHVRYTADLGDPNAAGLSGMRRSIAVAVAAAWGPDPGPVHLNARADKPLEPHPHGALRVEAGGPSLVPARLARASDPVVATISEALDRAERPMLVAGPMGLHAASLRELIPMLSARGVALFAECASQLRLGCGPDVLRADALDAWIERRPDCAPDVVLEIGATPTSAAYARWLERARPRRFVLAGARPRDPSGDAEAVVLGDAAATLREIAARLCRSPNPRWALGEAESDANRAIEQATLEGEAAVVREVARALPPGALLALGNSLPIRHADRVLRPGDADVGVLSQRGVNGIDGWVAGAVGASLGSEVPVVLILGDVAMAHDASSLALARGITRPLVIVVLDNRGGRIFERLPIADVADASSMALFTTPPQVALAPLADAYGVHYVCADDLPSVREALAEALERPAATLLHVPVPEHGAREVELQIREASR